MQKWVEGTVGNQKRWTQTLFTLQVEADIARFEAGQFAKLALAVEGEMVARPYSFVNSPEEHPHEFYYVTLPDGPLTQRLCKLQAGDAIYLAPRPAGFLALSEIPEGENLWLISTGTGVGPFLSILKTEGPWQRFKQVVLVHAVRHEEAPAPRAGPDHGGKLLVENRGQTTIFSKACLLAIMCVKIVVCPRFFLLAIGALSLAACSATRVAYDNADILLRFMASSYLDLDAAQSEDLTPRIARFHQWHRSNELPVYAALLRSASQRAAKGITAEDFAWGLANVRLRYRRFAAKAAEDAAPVLATLAGTQLLALERKFAENNEKYAREFLSSDDNERRRRQQKRMLERFRDFAGELTPDQWARMR